MSQSENIAQRIRGKKIVSYDIDYFIKSAYNLEDCIDFLPKFDQHYDDDIEQRYAHVFDRSLKLVPGAAIFACHEELPALITEMFSTTNCFVINFQTNYNSYNLNYKNQNLRNKLSVSGISPECTEIISNEAGLWKCFTLALNEEGLTNIAKLTGFPDKKVEQLKKLLKESNTFFHQYNIPLSLKTKFDELIKLIKPNTRPNLLVLSASFYTLVSDVFDLIDKTKENDESTNSVRSANLAQSAKSFIDDYANMVKNAQQLAEMLNTSVSTLQRQFKNTYNLSIGQYIKDRRLIAAKELLQQDMTIEEVSKLLGYSYRSAFERAYKNHFGMPPGAINSQTDAEHV